MYSRSLNGVCSSLTPLPLQEIASTGWFLFYYLWWVRCFQILRADQKGKKKMIYWFVVLYAYCSGMRALWSEQYTAIALSQKHLCLASFYFVFVLAFARLEFTFFTGDCMVLCFGVVTKIVLVRHGCFSCCLHRVKAFSVPHTTPPVRRLEVHKKLGGDAAQTAVLTQLTKRVSHTVSCCAQ